MKLLITAAFIAALWVRVGYAIINSDDTRKTFARIVPSLPKLSSSAHGRVGTADNSARYSIDGKPELQPLQAGEGDSFSKTKFTTYTIPSRSSARINKPSPPKPGPIARHNPATRIDPGVRVNGGGHTVVKKRCPYSR